jgi:hypothetical protein
VSAAFQPIAKFDLTETYSILQYVARSSLTTVSILNKRNIKDFQAVDEAVFIAYPAPDDRNLHSSFQSLAMGNCDRFSFGIADASLGTTDNISPSCVVCYKTLSGEQKRLCGESKLEALENFMETVTEPLVGEMTRRNEMKYLKVYNLFSKRFLLLIEHFLVWEVSSLRFRPYREGAFGVSNIIGALGGEIWGIPQLCDH